MPIRTIDLPFKNGTIYQIGDSHEGTQSQARQKLQDVIYMIKNERALWIHTGDAAESILVDDYRYDPMIHHGDPADLQVENIIEMFSPIKKSLVCLLMGNHERKIRSMNMTWAICKGLDRKDAYGSWTSILRFRDKSGIIRWTGFWTHGFNKGTLISKAGDAGQQKANTEAMLKKMLSPMHSAHYMGCGHYHKVVLRKPVEQLYLTTKEDGTLHKGYTRQPESGYIHPDLRWYGCNGGFIKQFMMGDNYSNESLSTIEPITYSEMAGYPPVDMGVIKLNIRNYMLHSCEVVMI